jgi:hypothetical protein
VRERASDLRKRGRRPSFLYLVGVSKTAPFWRSSGSGVAGLMTCTNARTDLGGFEVCGECVGKFGSGPSCWPDWSER